MMTSDTNSTWIPAFEFQNWIYQSFLVLPTPAENSAPPGTAINSKKWAMGKLQLSDSPDGYASTGTLSFGTAPDGTPIELKISVQGTPGQGNAPAAFEGVGTGTEGVTKGAIYKLVGWAFRGQDGKVESVHGSVQAVRGNDAKPEIELGKMPVGTVGAFVITRAA